MPERKFYKTIIELAVLSEDEPVTSDYSVESIAHEITEGSWSGQMKIASVQPLTAKEVAKELIDQESDPEFFDLDEDGNETRE